MSTPIEIDPASMSANPLPSAEGAKDKDDRGQVLVVAGGRSVPGAPLLTGLAALRAGAGKLQLASTPDMVAGLGLAALEAAIVPATATAAGELGASLSDALRQAARHADAIVVGPGMADEAAAGGLAAALTAANARASVVVDAAALTGIRLGLKGSSREGAMVLTPHAGEMAKLTGRSKQEVEADPLASARMVSKATHATVIMKGAETFVVSPEGEAWRHSGGVVGLATSGSGDVLAGVVAGLLARGAPPSAAAIWAVYLHAQAGKVLSETIGPVGLLARELLAEIPRLLADKNLSGAGV
jgi:hydroxyethylthiazole kinase-like uncharacterized protein yjeF